MIYDEILRESESRSNDRHIRKAKRIATMAYNLDVYDPEEPERQATEEDMYVVSFTYILGNWKALISTDLTEKGAYFEVTYSSSRERAFVDTYFKSINREIPDVSSIDISDPTARR